MDIEHEWICALVDERDFSVVLDNNVSDEWFGDEQHRRVFSFIRGHYASFSEVPSRQAIKSNYPTYKLPRPSDSMEYLHKELHAQFVHAQVRDSLLDIQEALQEGNGELALQYMQVASVSITTATAPLKDMILNDTWEQRLAQYIAARALTDGLRGLPTGFRSIDRACMGLQPEQLITIIGLAKSGKSTLALLIAIACQEYMPPDEVGLVIGFEMSNDEQSARYDAFTSHVSHHDMLSGRLTDGDAAKIEETGKQREGFAKLVLAADPSGMTTLSGISAKIEEHKPRFCIVDGAYLLDDENGESKGSSQALTNITRGLKRMCQRYKIPIICTTQALASKVQKRSGVTLDSIGYTSSFAQDSDLVIAAMAHETDPDQQILRVVASRIGPKLEVNILWDWATGRFEELDDGTDSPEVDLHPSATAAPRAARGPGQRKVEFSDEEKPAVGPPPSRAKRPHMARLSAAS